MNHLKRLAMLVILIFVYFLASLYNTICYYCKTFCLYLGIIDAEYIYIYIYIYILVFFLKKCIIASVRDGGSIWVT